MTNELITVLETSRILNKSTQSVRYYAEHGRLHAIRIGTHRIFFVRMSSGSNASSRLRPGLRSSKRAVHASKRQTPSAEVLEA